jgi:tetratricopeptide (TPR) repeat protein
MRKIFQGIQLVFLIVNYLLFISCKQKVSSPTNEMVSAIKLKKGELVACGPSDKEFGAVTFETSCLPEVKKDFELGLALLHSFEYDESEKAFAKVIEVDPACAMAYWGVAMANYHPLWAPPTPLELEKGAKAIAVAQSISNKSDTESDYINAIAGFFKDVDKLDHRTRSINYRSAMEKFHEKNPTNKEAAIFYALALVATADPADKSFVNQKKAGGILSALYPEGASHPGIVHYIIHTYDSPELATLGLEAARKYASIAPSSSHAQHMPSHIFTRLGLWDECINSNFVAASSAQCYAQSAGIKGHWDEELHALDYLMYGYLQKGDNNNAKTQLDYFYSIDAVDPINSKVLYSFAAGPSRYYLENKMWKEAASLPFHPANYPWEKFPWEKGIIHFARALGSVHNSQLDQAKTELRNLQAIRDTLLAKKDDYRANQVHIQIHSVDAWIQYKEGKNAEALKLMNTAAEMEDKTEKHPVTPGEVMPARELLGDMLLAMNKPVEALEAYEANLKKRPNRFNGIYGAAQASERAAYGDKASTYYQQLTNIPGSIKSNRLELETARLYLRKNIAGR